MPWHWLACSRRMYCRGISKPTWGPWIPAADIHAFACELFGVPAESIRIDHSAREAFWSVEADYRAVQSVAATADFGTGRINGTTLLDQALNLKTPTIYDTVHAGDKVDGVAKWPVQRATHFAERPVTARIRDRLAGEVSESEEGTPSPLGHTNRQDKLRKQQASINQHS